MKEDTYQDQFSPWIPNHLVADVEVPVCSDILVGIVDREYQKGNITWSGELADISFSALLANHYIKLTQSSSRVSGE